MLLLSYRYNYGYWSESLSALALGIYVLAISSLRHTRVYKLNSNQHGMARELALEIENTDPSSRLKLGVNSNKHNSSSRYKADQNTN